MSNQTFMDEPEFANHEAQVNQLLHKLSSKLKNFTVSDSNGQFVGTVKNLFLTADRQLKLVISQLSSDLSRCFLLSSQMIQDIDPASRSLYLSASQTELAGLPEYESAEASALELASPVSDSTRKNSMLTPDPLSANQAQPELHTPEVPASRVISEEIVSLLEERLVVNQLRRKVGEVIVRKVVETEVVEVPVRREKLIVEQVSPELKQLAAIDLGKGEMSGVELAEVSGQLEATPADPASVQTQDSSFSVRGEFLSARTASMLLDAIALERPHGCAKVRVEIELADPRYRETYQAWFDRCSNRELG